MVTDMAFNHDLRHLRRARTPVSFGIMVTMTKEPFPDLPQREEPTRIPNQPPVIPRPTEPRIDPRTPPVRIPSEPPTRPRPGNPEIG
jgi:hypothetical protein